MERLVGAIQPYAWGSKTALPEFLGVEATGEPQAELWLGAHPMAPAQVGDHGLDKLVESAPETVVGGASVAKFGPRLPFLVKVLAAGQPLSLQAHPSRTQAEIGFAREEAAGIDRQASNRMYRDDWPKPEAICALGEFHALCGFRRPEETYALFEQLSVPAATDLVSPLQDGDVRGVFAALLQLDHDQRSVVAEVAAAAEALLDAPEPLALFARTAVELNSFYPGDPGVLATLLMNRVILQRNEALFLPAGNLHAYISGLGVEIMANSDNVLRGGLTPKHIDIDELLSVLDFTPGFDGLVPMVEESPGVWSYQTPAPEFSLWRMEAEHARLALPGEQSGRIVLVTDGTATLSVGGQQLPLKQGESAFVTAEEDGVQLTGPATVFVGAPGIR